MRKPVYRRRWLAGSVRVRGHYQPPSPTCDPTVTLQVLWHRASLSPATVCQRRLASGDRGPRADVVRPSGGSSAARVAGQTPPAAPWDTVGPECRLSARELDQVFFSLQVFCCWEDSGTPISPEWRGYTRNQPGVGITLRPSVKEESNLEIFFYPDQKSVNTKDSS